MVGRHRGALAELRTATGRDFDVQYCQLMIRHNLVGVMMVQGVLDCSRRGEVLALAGAMKTSQQNEIVALQQLLAGPWAAPV